MSGGSLKKKNQCKKTEPASGCHMSNAARWQLKVSRSAEIKTNSAHLIHHKLTFINSTNESYCLQLKQRINVPILARCIILHMRNIPWKTTFPTGFSEKRARQGYRKAKSAVYWTEGIRTALTGLNGKLGIHTHEQLGSPAAQIRTHWYLLA